MTEAIVFDVDGTLANNDHRQHLLIGQKPNWDAFFAAMAGDQPNEPIIKLYEALKNTGKYTCILVSGRPEIFRNQTIDWLNQNRIFFDLLKMRPAGDRRPDHEVKEEILRDLQTEGFQILFAIDDRTSTVKMWRANGIMCLQCADHDF